MNMIVWTRDVEWKWPKRGRAEVVWRTQNVLCYGGYKMAPKWAMMDVVGIQDMRATREVI